MKQFRPISAILFAIILLLAAAGYSLAEPIKECEVRLPGPFNFLVLQEYDGIVPLSYWCKNEKYNKEKGKLYSDISSILKIKIDTDRLAESDDKLGVDKEVKTVKSTIRDEIVDAIGFFTAGKISLAARIADRPIEVEGYSEVGKNRTVVGTTGMPPHKFILNMKLFQYKINRLLLDLSKIEEKLKLKLIQDDEQTKLLRYYNEVKSISRILKIFMSDSSTATAIFKVVKASPTYIEDSSLVLDEIISKSESNISRIQQNPSEISSSADYLKAAIEQDSTKITLKNNELNQYQSALRNITGEKKNISEIDLRLKQLKEEQKEIEGNLKKYEAKITEIEARFAISSDDEKKALRDEQINLAQSIEIMKDKDKENKANVAKYEELTQQINERLRKLGSQAKFDELQKSVETLTTEIADLNKSVNTNMSKLASLSEGYSNGEYLKFFRQTYQLIKDLEENINYDVKHHQKVSKIEIDQEDLNQYWNEPRRKSAYKEIYKNLTEGQIVIRKIDAKPGDVITIELLYYQFQADKPVSYTIAEIYVGDYSWNTTVADSFLLVKAMNEKSSSNVSPSNFKGAAGVSLFWSKNPRPEQGYNWFYKNLSWGVNVSYLDFDTTKDFEVGVGPIIGFFDNRIHIGLGYNLNSEGSFSNKTYFFLGFSFAKIADRIFSKSTAN